MNKKEKFSFLKGKGASVGIVLCFVAVITEASILEWPASGATLIGYSMDQTVYFPTLEEYKYNPAMIIGGEVGESIKASATGTVSSIEETAQTGTTVTSCQRAEVKRVLHCDATTSVDMDALLSETLPAVAIFSPQQIQMSCYNNFEVIF